MIATIDAPVITGLPRIRPGLGVTLFVSDCPDPVFGVVLDVYTDACGTEVAEVQVNGRPTDLRNTEHLTLAVSR